MLRELSVTHHSAPALVELASIRQSAHRMQASTAVAYAGCQEAAGQAADAERAKLRGDEP
jgi:hypothetical protein